MNNIKSYSYSYDCVGRIDKDYVDNIIVRMYFGKVCDGTLSEQQFMQRLNELWAVNSSHRLVKVKAIGDSSKSSTVMDVRDSHTLINIPVNWPESPTCDIKANSKCRLFSQCIRYNNVVAQTEAQVVVNTLVNAYNESSSQHNESSSKQSNVGVSGPPNDLIGTVGESVNENISSDDLVKQAKDIPWGWVAIGGLAFVGSIIMIAAIKSNTSDYGSSSSGSKQLEESNLIKKIRQLAISSADEAYKDSQMYSGSESMIESSGYFNRATGILGRKLTDYEQQIFTESFNKHILKLEGESISV